MTTRGRPKVFDDLKTITLTITTDELKALDQLCDKFQVSRHEVIGRLLNLYFDSEYERDSDTIETEEIINE